MSAGPLGGPVPVENSLPSERASRCARSWWLTFCSESGRSCCREPFLQALGT